MESDLTPQPPQLEGPASGINADSDKRHGAMGKRRGRRYPTGKLKHADTNRRGVFLSLVLQEVNDVPVCD